MAPDRSDTARASLREHAASACERNVGSVVQLARYPLRGAGAELLADVDVDAEGLRADRRWVLLDLQGEALGGREASWLREVEVSVHDGELAVDVGAGKVVGTEAEAALGRLARSSLSAGGTGGDDSFSGDSAGGEGAVRIAASAGHRGGVQPVHLVSAGAQTAPDAPGGCDPDPRANLVVDLHTPGAERGWVGRRLRVGEATLEVTGTPRRCFGVYAQVLRPGRVATGDAVVLLATSSADLATSSADLATSSADLATSNADPTDDPTDETA